MTIHRITDRGLEKLTGSELYLAPKQRYYVGASDSPTAAIVDEIDDRGRVWYYTYPYRERSMMPENIFRDLATRGCRRWLLTRGDAKTWDAVGGMPHWAKEMRMDLISVLGGVAGRDRDYRACQVLKLSILPPHGTTDPYSDFERRFAPHSVSGVHSESGMLTVYLSRGETRDLKRIICDSGYRIVDEAEGHK